MLEIRPGEINRRYFVKSQIDDLRNKIVKGHKVCNGSGFISETRLGEDSLSEEIAFPCSCFKKFREISRFLSSNIPYQKIINAQVYEKNVVVISTGEVISFRKSVFNPYIKKIRKVVKKPFGLSFFGKHGVGKTFVGLKVLYYAISNGLTGHYIEFPEFLKLVRRGFGEDLNDLIDEISKVDILMIDEIGAESKREDFSISELKSIYRKRIDMNKPTIICTNYSTKEFKDTYGYSIFTVVEAYSMMLDFNRVPDVRKTKSQNLKNQFFKSIMG